MLSGNTMACHIGDREDQAERYVAGLLPESESEAFEQHFFACSPCLSAVRRAEALLDALSTASAPARRGGSVVRLAAAAAVLVAAALVTLRPPGILVQAPANVASEAPVATNPYADLATFEPPSPPSVRLRGGAPPDLERGLDRYRQKDFPAAVQALRTASRTSSEAAVPFFLGVSLFMVGETDQAITTLNAALARGDSPYLEDAHLCLARAHFAKGDFLAAERQLEMALSLRGDRGDEARALLKISRSRRPARSR